MNRDLLAGIERLLRPLRTTMRNMIARGVVQLAPDGAKLRLLQIGALFGETIDNAEHFEPYGFTSVPLAGAEHVTIFPAGDRAHPITLVASDRRYRPGGKQPGEVTMYNNAGASMTMTKDGDIIGTPAPGRKFLVTDGSGTTEPVVKQSEFLGHGHATAATGPVSPPTPAPSSTPAATFPGTTLFESE